MSSDKSSAALAWATSFAAITTLALAGTTVYLACQTSEAAKATKEAAEATEEQAKETTRIADALQEMLDIETQPTIEKTSNCDATFFRATNKIKFRQPRACRTLLVHVFNPSRKNVEILMRLPLDLETPVTCLAKDNVQNQGDPVELAAGRRRVFELPIDMCLQGLSTPIPDTISGTIDMQILWE